MPLTREFNEITHAASVARYCQECGSRKPKTHFCERCLALLPRKIVEGLTSWKGAPAAYLAAIRHFEQNPTPPRPLIGKPPRLLGGTRKAYKYHNDFRVTARFDCHYRVECETLPEALSACEPRRGREPFLSVHADCRFDGVADVAYVGLSLSEVDGMTEADIWRLLDLEVDSFIASRVNTGHWHPWEPG